MLQLRNLLVPLSGRFCLCYHFSRKWYSFSWQLLGVTDLLLTNNGLQIKVILFIDQQKRVECGGFICFFLFFVLLEARFRGPLALDGPLPPGSAAPPAVSLHGPPLRTVKMPAFIPAALREKQPSLQKNSCAGSTSNFCQEVLYFWLTSGVVLVTMG